MSMVSLDHCFVVLSQAIGDSTLPKAPFLTTATYNTSYMLNTTNAQIFKGEGAGGREFVNLISRSVFTDKKL